MSHIQTERQFSSLQAISLVTLIAIALAGAAQAGISRVTGNLFQARFQHYSFLLADGKILVFGGLNPPRQAVTVTELYDPTTGKWTTSGDLRIGRLASAATLLADGRSS